MRRECSSWRVAHGEWTAVRVESWEVRVAFSERRRES